MSHRSRLTAVLVDVPAAEHERAVSFWTAALGRPGERGQQHPEYHHLGEVTPGLTVMVQAVGDDVPRVHLDIETDDVAAEVARLSALGATSVGQVQGWTIMRDPAGVVFCVVPVQTPEAFERDATRWP